MPAKQALIQVVVVTILVGTYVGFAAATAVADHDGAATDDDWQYDGDGSREQHRSAYCERYEERSDREYDCEEDDRDENRSRDPHRSHEKNRSVYCERYDERSDREYYCRDHDRNHDKHDTRRDGHEHVHVDLSGDGSHMVVAVTYDGPDAALVTITAVEGTYEDAGTYRVSDRRTLELAVPEAGTTLRVTVETEHASQSMLLAFRGVSCDPAAVDHEWRESDDPYEGGGEPRVTVPVPGEECETAIHGGFVWLEDRQSRQTPTSESRTRPVGRTATPADDRPGHDDAHEIYNETHQTGVERYNDTHDDGWQAYEDLHDAAVGTYERAHGAVVGLYESIVGGQDGEDDTPNARVEDGHAEVGTNQVGAGANATISDGEDSHSAGVDCGIDPSSPPPSREDCDVHGDDAVESGGDDQPGTDTGERVDEAVEHVRRDAERIRGDVGDDADHVTGDVQNGADALSDDITTDAERVAADVQDDRQHIREDLPGAEGGDNGSDETPSALDPDRPVAPEPPAEGNGSAVQPTHPDAPGTPGESPQPEAGDDDVDADASADVHRDGTDVRVDAGVSASAAHGDTAVSAERRVSTGTASKAGGSVPLTSHFGDHIQTAENWLSTLQKAI